jgi:cob(I)alamin adenosyltransferase
MDLAVIERRVNELWKFKARIERMIGDQSQGGDVPPAAADHPAQVLHGRIDQVSSDLAGLQTDLADLRSSTVEGGQSDALRALENRLDSLQTDLRPLIDFFVERGEAMEAILSAGAPSAADKG